jgi:GMP synthase (glutamine-hydrolysing)
MQADALPFLVSGVSRADIGQLEGVLAAAGRPFEFVERWGLTDVEFALERHAGLIILGDSRHWATSRKYQRERGWLVAALAHRRPVLGICFGAQLMAAHLAGITSGRSLAKPPNNDHVGKIAPVEVRGAGRNDPVVAPLRRAPLATMSHEDCFQVPPGTTGLAWSTDTTLEHCEAFRLGPPEDAVYGLQFHPEPTPEMLARGWFKEVPDADTLSTVAATGNSILTEWVRLAVAR